MKDPIKKSNPVTTTYIVSSCCQIRSIIQVLCTVSKALKFGCNTLDHRRFQIYSLSLKMSLYGIVPETNNF